MRATQRIERILADPTASYWLKNAIAALRNNRDIVDAANDAELLASLFTELCADALLASRVAALRTALACFVTWHNQATSRSGDGNGSMPAQWIVDKAIAALESTK